MTDWIVWTEALMRFLAITGRALLKAIPLRADPSRQLIASRLFLARFATSSRPRKRTNENSPPIYRWDQR